MIIMSVTRFREEGGTIIFPLIKSGKAEPEEVQLTVPTDFAKFGVTNGY